MAAYRVTALLLLCVGPVAGAVFRHAAETSHSAVANAEEVRRVAGLLDVEKDLEVDKKKDDTNLHELESQIVALVRKRDAAKRDEGRKDREIAFLQNQIGKSRVEDRTAAEQQTHQESKADLNVDAAIASADQVVSQAESTESVTQHTEEKAAQAAAAQAAQAAAEAVAQRRAQEEAAASAAAAAAAREELKKEKKKAEQEESRAAFEARIRAEAEEKATMKIKAEQEAEDRIRAAQAKVRAKADAEEKGRVEAEVARREAANAEEKQKAEAQAEAERKKKDSLADSADDSFKQFMKEEDGEDQQGDADYEDSANALAGAIGWDRHEIESKADSAVKQLTEAIGGKKVVQSLQGMMAGVR